MDLRRLRGKGAKSWRGASRGAAKYQPSVTTWQKYSYFRRIFATRAVLTNKILAFSSMSPYPRRCRALVVALPSLSSLLPCPLLSLPPCRRFCPAVAYALPLLLLCRRCFLLSLPPCPRFWLTVVVPLLLLSSCHHYLLMSLSLSV